MPVDPPVNSRSESEGRKDFTIGVLYDNHISQNLQQALYSAWNTRHVSRMWIDIN